MFNIKRLFIIISLSISATTLPAVSFSQTDKSPGVIIPDNNHYTFYAHSKLINNKSGKYESIQLNKNTSSTTSLLKTILNTWKLPYKILSESPIILKTDWLLWHYDKESNKTFSKPENSFFTLNVRDRYRFKLLVKSHDDKTEINILQVKREQETDITPSSAMTWIEWKPKSENKQAVHAFLLHLQTAFETLAVSEHTKNIIGYKKSLPLAAPAAAATTTQAHSNHISLDMNTDQAWSLLITRLTQKSIAIESIHSDQHMLNTKWQYADFNPEKDSWNNLEKDNQRHKFQFIVIPGTTNHSSSIFVSHTAFQQNSGKQNSDSFSWSDRRMQQEIAAAFLNSLNLK